MLFNQQNSMKEKLKSGFESSCDWTSVILNIGRWRPFSHWTSVDGPFLTRLTTKPHQDIIIFIILAISFSISLYNLSEKGTFQMSLFWWPWSQLGIPVENSYSRYLNNEKLTPNKLKMLISKQIWEQQNWSVLEVQSLCQVCGYHTRPFLPSIIWWIV